MFFVRSVQARPPLNLEMTWLMGPYPTPTLKSIDPAVPEI